MFRCIEHETFLENNQVIMLTCQCNKGPLTSHFYIVKLGCTWVFIIFFIFALKHRLWVLVRAALHVPIIYVLSKNKKKSSDIFQCYSYEILQYIVWA